VELGRLNQPDSCKTDTGKPPFKASEGGCFENLRVSEDITPSEFQQGKGTRVPIRPKVRLEASPNGLPMSVSSKVYATLRSIVDFRFLNSPPPFPSPIWRLCRNHDGEWIPTESRPGGIRFFSFRMRSFKVMGNRPCWKRVSFHGFGSPKLSDERFPPCLRPARRDYAQAGLKLHHPTACSVLKQK